MFNNDPYIRIMAYNKIPQKACLRESSHMVQKRMYSLLVQRVSKAYCKHLTEPCAVSRADPIT